MKCTCRKSWEDEVFGESARLAFYFFLAMFPLLLLLFILLGFVHAGPGWRGALFGLLGQVLPPDASALVTQIVNQLQARAIIGAGAILAGLSAVWGTLNGTWAIITGLNKAYEVEETRPWWCVLSIALGLTVCLCTFGLTALAWLHFGGHVIGPHVHAAARFGFLRNVTEWTITVLLLLVSLILLYRFAPNLKDRRWQWSVPGAAVASILWLAFVLLLRTYQEHASSSQRIYGELNAVVTLLLWLYLTGAAIFIGGELNSQIVTAGKTGQQEIRK